MPSKVLTEQQDLLRFGDILLEHGARKDLLGRSIQAVMREPYCHAAIVVHKDRIFEAMPWVGVGYSSTEPLLQSKVTILRPSVPLSDADLHEVSCRMAEITGCGYDYLGLAHLAWMAGRTRFLDRNFRFKQRWNPSDMPRKFFCYQAAAYVYSHCCITTPIHWTNATSSDFLCSTKLEVIASDFSEAELDVQKRTSQAIWQIVA